MSEPLQIVDLEKNKIDLSSLFKDFHWNFIPDAIREGSLGEVLVDDLDNPDVSLLRIPEFKVSFFGGNAISPGVRDIIENLPFGSMVMFSSEAWPKVLREIHAKKWIVMPRFGFSQEGLNVAHLRGFQERVSDEFRIEKIDLVIAETVMKMAKDKVRFVMEQLFGFSSAEDFIKRGVGYVAYEGEEIVSISAAGAACKKGIEIQVNTRKEYEGRGLGSAVSAALIIDCLENNIVPNWDAATEESAGLAKKLGFTPKGEYVVYVYVKFNFLVHLRTFLRKIRGKGIIEP